MRVPSLHSFATILLACGLAACGAQAERSAPTVVDIPPPAPAIETPGAATSDDVRSPPAPPKPKAPVDDSVFTVVITHKGTLYANGEPVGSLESLQVHAIAAHARNLEVRAVLQVDREVVYARVVDVMDVLRKASITRVAFAVTPKP